MSNLTKFQEDALQYDHHLAVTANAGSGKTMVLSKRFVKIFVENNISIDSIIAITFTDKAAAELFVKISNEIEEQLGIVKDEFSRKKLIKLRSNLINAKISTIHSFCADLLREFATETGIDSSYSVFDQQQRDIFVDNIIEEYLSEQLIKQNEKVKSLVRIFGSVAITAFNFKKVIDAKNLIVKLFVNLFSKSDDIIENYYSEKESELFKEYFQKEIHHFRNKLATINNLVENKGEAGKAKKIVDELLSKLLDDTEFTDFKFIINELSKVVLKKDGGIKKRGYFTLTDDDKFRSDTEYVENYFNEFLNAFNPDVIENKLFLKFIKDSYPIFLELIELYETKKRRFNFLDFDDLLIKVEELVNNNNVVLESLKNKYKYIMIDEFQDTNEIQYNIFIPILDRLANGNLFVVGDEKQSIYMFRDAELEIFQKTKNEISSIPSGTIIQLPHSFRHSPKIAFFTNYIFSNLFEKPKLFFNEVENKNLICTDDDYGKGFVEIFFSNEESKSEADMVSERILYLINDRKLMYGEIAILSRKKSSFENIESSLLKNNIPFLTIGGTGFYQQQIILDINNYLMFLINPMNDLALVGILRSPFFYFSDRDIFLISQSTGKSLFEKLEAFQNEKNLYSEAVRLLKENIFLSEQISIQSLINKIMTESGYLAVLFARENYQQDYSNYQKLLSISNFFSSSSYKSLYDFTQFLKSAAVNIDDEGQAIIPSEVDAVKIMTVHKAKGLQFKAVFIVDANSKTYYDSIRARNIFFDKEYGVLLSLPEKNYFNKFRLPAIANIYNFRKSKKEIAETKRLLYVALTRAAEYLFISADLANEKVSPKSFWNFLHQALRDDFKNSELLLKGKLQIDKQDRNGIIEKDFEMTVPINKSYESNIPLNKAQLKIKIPSVNLNEKIISIQSGEIISASKINIFNQCPQKYHLIYNLGLDELMKKLRSNELKTDLKIRPNQIGSAVHFILQQNVSEDNLQILISRAVDKYALNENSTTKNLFRKKIELMIKKFLSSEIYFQLSAYQSFYNEFQIYLKEFDYFLFGIIDKLIVEKNRLIVIDYKTDSVTPKNLELKISNYEYQLRFYAYLAMKYFSMKNEIEVKLIFIKNPEKSYSKIYSDFDLLNFGVEIRKIVSAIRNNSFDYNINHCTKCQFLYRNKCVAQQSS